MRDCRGDADGQLTGARHIHARTCTPRAPLLHINHPQHEFTTGQAGHGLICPSDAHSASAARATHATRRHSWSTRHMSCHRRHATHPVATVTAPRAQTPAKTTPARHTQSPHITHQAHPAAACGHAAQRERGGVIEAHWPSAAAARGMREEGVRGRPHRCSPLLTDMPLRMLSSAQIQARPRRPGEAPTCRGTRTAHVESAPRGLRRGRKPAGGGNSAHARTYRHARWARPVPFGVFDVVVGPASILRKGATHAVSVWTDAWRGHETTRGRRQHLQIAQTSPDGRLSRDLRREGARRDRQRRAVGMQGACRAAVLMGAHGAAHDVPSAQRAEGLWL